MLKTILSVLAIAAASLSYAASPLPTNAGSWPSGVSIVWTCPDTGPVFQVPIVIVSPVGEKYTGYIQCGAKDGTTLTPEEQAQVKKFLGS